MGALLDTVAVIPARGGSKGISHKNIRRFCGKPLLEWTARSAIGSGIFDAVVLSTDDRRIARIGRQAGLEVPFLRPAKLATDRTPTADVIRHTLDFLREERGLEFRYTFILEPTSPTRTRWHICEAFHLLRSSGADTVAGITAVPHHYVPEKVLRMDSNGRIAGRDGTPVARMKHRRQDLAVSYAFNGLIWACQTKWLLRDPPTLWGKNVVGYLIPERYAVDLDVPEDWPLAEARMRLLRGRGR
jgi:CMP-N-acetylneuraminic acid synthetase